MNIGRIQIGNRESGRAVRLKEAVLASFNEPAPLIAARLAEFTADDWKHAKNWLDISGLALYFLDRLETLNLQSSVSEALLQQLRTNLADNRKRSASLFDEAVRITRVLRQLGIECAVLKGVTIPPESVPQISLRNQMDLDLLIRESDANRVRNCIAEFGYSLDAISGSTWEFKAGPSGTSSLKNLYQVRPERALEMHLCGRQHQWNPELLSRSEWRSANGYLLPALSPVDLFVLQAQHLFKHICGEHTRASWVLEYWRHVCGRRNDSCFWHKVKASAADQRGAEVAIGTATLLASMLFGPFAPAELTSWSVDRLPVGVCRWLQLYGRRIILSGNSGSKLYLLLRKELDPFSAGEKSVRRRLLLPFHWPQRITRAAANETLLSRVRRIQLEAKFVFSRLRFHVSESFLLAVETFRWQRRGGGVSR